MKRILHIGKRITQEDIIILNMHMSNITSNS